MCPPLVFGAQKKPGLDRVKITSNRRCQENHERVSAGDRSNKIEQQELEHNAFQHLEV